jgi:antitoxin component of MazEF toxin-antitoxin module
MSAVKLQKIGNSLGFRVPKPELEKAGFDVDSEYELISEKGIISLVKRRPHHSQWQFPQADLSKEDREWLEADLGDDGEAR